MKFLTHMAVSIMKNGGRVRPEKWERGYIEFDGRNFVRDDGSCRNNLISFLFSDKRFLWVRVE